MIYELRFFNDFDDCFRLECFTAGKPAYDRFWKVIENTAKARDALVAAGCDANVVAKKIQLVQRDDGMTFIVCCEEWGE